MGTPHPWSLDPKLNFVYFTTDGHKYFRLDAGAQWINKHTARLGDSLVGGELE